MNGNNLLLDTNIVLYFLSGDDTLAPLFEEKNIFISIITEIEILGFHELSETELEDVQGFLSFCSVVNINQDIKEKAAKLRRDHQLKLPDSIIAATAESLGIPFITADKDFKKIQTANIIYYDSSR
jgi:predicted nucleic acid-binding protein